MYKMNFLMTAFLFWPLKQLASDLAVGCSSMEWRILSRKKLPNNEKTIMKYHDLIFFYKKAHKILISYNKLIKDNELFNLIIDIY